MYLESSGFRLDAGAVEGRVFSGVLGFLMLHTRTGRRRTLAGRIFHDPRLNPSKSTASARRPVRKQVIRESRVAYGDEGGRV